MAEKVFHRFDDLDPADEAVIGGVHRHERLLAPADLVGRDRLLVPGDEAMTARWEEARGPRSAVGGPDGLPRAAGSEDPALQRAGRGQSLPLSSRSDGHPSPSDGQRPTVNSQLSTVNAPLPRPLVVEVGSGRGRFLAALAVARPDGVFLGFETRLSNCVRTLDRGDKAGCTNLWMAWGDARFHLPRLVPAGTADEAYLLFPDPWWKKRHARRRHGGAMATALAGALRPGGLLVLKSDVPEYLAQMVESFAATGLYDPAPAPVDLPRTDREVRLVNQGTKVFTAAFSRR